jgi:hypothetical protein
MPSILVRVRRYYGLQQCKLAALLGARRQPGIKRRNHQRLKSHLADVDAAQIDAQLATPYKAIQAERIARPLCSLRAISIQKGKAVSRKRTGFFVGKGRRNFSQSLVLPDTCSTPLPALSYFNLRVCYPTRSLYFAAYY